ncbi:glycerophosphodiester phosphodiesterase family protein [Primorskyibacter aestuariivivens]|uniref:glycerophosphodiester phosphodiesterase family protein n=1 Tax=Primorskyibacter aestuariivivens TaxID=1888912 RepID=UPI0022FFDD79|nr:glycerophosphodiester phosphodiesterase family protein [Primorskyibacter aestuariivivens]MDA7428292.1 glycerophosphodiester phosphodiesterase family protein [Primorskyibacter aestuariivivens]
MMLPPAFLERPIAHRALHDLERGRPENALSSVRAAIENGYGIEIDLQRSRDGLAMVFHDYDLRRLTRARGPIALRDSAELRTLALTGSTEGIPTLTDLLTLVAGRVPLLIELKDQDGTLGPNVGALERATAEALSGYTGPVAVMSFNPHSVSLMGTLAPDIPRGLTTCDFPKDDWLLIPDATRRRLRDIPDFASTGASFISHHARNLHSDAVTRIKQDGHPVLCWTIRSPEEEAEALRVADNITFEGYLP